MFEIKKHMGKFELCLNFSEKQFHLFKETNSLKKLGFSPIFSITLRSHDIQSMFPIALSLQDSLRTFNYINTQVNERFDLLVAKVRLTTQKSLLNGLSLQWKHTKIDRYSKELTKIVLTFEDAVN